MANRYANLVGSNKISEEYTKINDGFDAVETDMDGKAPASVGTDLAAHIGSGGASHAAATPSVAGFMSAGDKTKLDGVEEGAETNQNAFAQVNDIDAANPSDGVTLEGGVGITVTTNPTEKKVTITATGSSTPGPHGPSHTEFGPDPVPNATETEGGLMSAVDKAKLDGMGDEISDLAGAGRTTETVKGNADELAALKAETVTRVENIVTGHGADPTGAINGADALYAACATGNAVYIPDGTYDFTLSAVQVQTVIGALGKIRSESIVTIKLPAGVQEFSGAEIARISQYSANIKLVGADPVETTLTGVTAVTGSNGNYAVTFSLTSSADIEVGDVLHVSNVNPGDFYSDTSTRRPYDNELTIGFYKLGTLTTSGTTCTLGTGGQNAHLSIGDLVHVRGQTRKITAIDADPAKTFTVDSAWDFPVSAAQFWYFTKANEGTVGTGGAASSTITGAGTSFLSDCNVGDVLIVDGMFLKITAITSNTSLNVTHNVNIPSGKPYSFMTAGILHEGSFEVTAVVGNNVTVRNRSRYVAPPVNKISTGVVRSIKTVLKQTGSGNGFVFERGGILNDMCKIALQGNGSSTASVGIALNGADDGYDLGNGVITMTDPCAVIEWGTGVTLSSGCVLFAYLAHICNNFMRGVDASEGSDAYVRSAVISHNNGVGLFVSGGYARVSDARFCGNNDQGIRQDVGSSVYGDMPVAWGNGSHGFMLVNFCGIQFVDGYSIANGGSGGNFQNTAGGRVTRTLFAANGAHGLSVYNGKVEGVQCWYSGSGSGQSGLTCSNAEVTSTSSAATGNVANGYFGLASAKIIAADSFASKNGQVGARASDLSEIQIINSYTTGNVGGSTNNLTGGVVYGDSNRYGARIMGSHYREVTTIADDAVLVVPIGINVAIAVTIVSRTVATVYGIIRANIAASPSIASIAGTGITTTTGVLTGTTGTDGNFTVSAGNDGNLYIENRMGGAREITIDIMGGLPV